MAVQQAVSKPMRVRWEVLRPRRRRAAWWVRRVADPWDLFEAKAIALGLLFLAGAGMGG
jgi:hypothetical protein